MNFFLDLSLIALLAVTIGICWHRGLIRSVIGFGKTLLCIFVAYLFGGRASAWISQLWISNRVTEYVHGRLSAIFDAGVETFNPSIILENIPSWLQTFFERMGMDMTDLISKVTDKAVVDAQGLEEISRSLAAPITKLISDFIGYTGVYLIALIVISIVAFFLVKIADLPVIRKIDRALGCLLGIGCAAIYVSVYTLLVFALFSLIEGRNPDFAFHAAYDKTWIFRIFYDINLFRWIFGIG